MSVNEKMTAIADAIRAKTGKTETLNLDQMAESVPEVYEAGKKSEYDAFWDNYQQNGNRTNYVTAFGSCWNKDNFKPKYSIRPKSAYMMFFNNTGAVIDLGEAAEDYFDSLGIELDYSKATFCAYGIAALHAKRFKKLDFSSATDMSNLFYSHNNPNTNGVEEIDEFVSSEITTYHNSAFQHAIWLREIRFTGVIAKNNLNLSYSTLLSHDSLMSAINCLQDKTTDTSGTTWKITLGANNKAKLTDSELQTAYDKNWAVA